MNRLLFYVTHAARISPSLHTLSTSVHAPELASKGLEVLAGSGRRPEVCQLSMQHNRHSGGYIIHGGKGTSGSRLRRDRHAAVPSQVFVGAFLRWS